MEKRVEHLKKRLKDVEYRSSSMSGEIVSLKMALQKVSSSNKTSLASSLTLPSIYSFLPHLIGQPKGLEPLIKIGSSTPKKGMYVFLDLPSSN